jgi:hypothetical protein
VRLDVLPILRLTTFAGSALTKWRGQPVKSFILRSFDPLGGGQLLEERDLPVACARLVVLGEAKDSRPQQPRWSFSQVPRFAQDDKGAKLFFHADPLPGLRRLLAVPQNHHVA